MLAKHLLQLVEDAFTLGVILASDAIDSWSSKETRQQILQRLHEAAERGAELALENATLKEEIQGLRFSGPSLYADEVAALEYAIFSPGNLSLPSYEKEIEALKGLYNRCDHMPMTSDEVAGMILDAINGRIKDFNWDDIGKDVDTDDYVPFRPSECKHSGWDFNYGNCPDCGAEGGPG